MQVAELRRYAVKAMAGEAVPAYDVDARGVAGDRWYAVVDGEGRMAAAKSTRRFRRYDAVLGWTARLDATGVEVRAPAAPGCGEHPAAGTGRQSFRLPPPGLPDPDDADDSGSLDPGLDAALSASLGTPVRVRPESAVPHFDAGSVSLVGTATLAWCRDRLGIDADHRRLRPNILVATEEPFVEERWVGAEVRIGGVGGVGGVVLRVVERVERCRVVDLAQDGVTTTTPMLRALADHRELSLAVYADVVTPGRISRGDPVVPVVSVPPGGRRGPRTPRTVAREQDRAVTDFPGD